MMTPQEHEALYREFGINSHVYYTKVLRSVLRKRHPDKKDRAKVSRDTVLAWIEAHKAELQPPSREAQIKRQKQAEERRSERWRFERKKEKADAERAARVLIERNYRFTDEVVRALSTIRTATRDKQLARSLKREIDDLMKRFGPSGRFAMRWSNLASEFIVSQQKGVIENGLHQKTKREMGSRLAGLDRSAPLGNQREPG